jgi:hypothetical protein
MTTYTWDYFEGKGYVEAYNEESLYYRNGQVIVHTYGPQAERNAELISGWLNKHEELVD